MHVLVQKIAHRGAMRIGLFFPKNFEIQAKLKTIGASYSATLNCWYIDYSAEKFKQLKSLQLNLLLPESKEKDALVAGPEGRENPHIADDGALLHPEQRAKAEHKPDAQVAPYPDLKLLEPIGKYWVFSMHYRQAVVRQLLGIKGVYWNKTHKCYMAMQHEKVRQQVHAALGLTDFLPLPQAMPAAETFAGMVITLKPHPADTRLLQVHLPAHFVLIEKLKRFAFAQYSKANQCYLLPATSATLEALKLMFEPEHLAFAIQLPAGYLKTKNTPKRKFLDLSQSQHRLLVQVPEGARPLLESYLNRLLAKNYSPATLKNYGGAFVSFLRDHGYADPGQLTEAQVIKYLAGLMVQGMASATGNNMVNALKFYYHEVAKQTGWQLALPRPKKEKQLPTVLTKAECMQLFQQIVNQKHRLMMLLTYGAGLRISEVVSMKWGDILTAEYKIHIKAAKGKKDRMVMLPLALVEYLAHYRELQPRNAPNDYVFEGQRFGEPYSTGSLQAIMRRALASSGIGKKATVHTLRHSFATHLLEGGTDIRYIQGFLGHSSINTTTIYTHLTQAKVANIASPLDTLPLPKPKEKT